MHQSPHVWNAINGVTSLILQPFSLSAEYINIQTTSPAIFTPANNIDNETKLDFLEKKKTNVNQVQ